nr:GAG1At protein [Tanacetum cinerariifolium]
RSSKMGSEMKSGGFRAKMEHYLYSGEKKHVFAGMAIITVIFGVPWYLMNRGTKQLSHQDYLEKADRARNARLHSAPPPESK